jgi:hypothetical protein
LKKKSFYRLRIGTAPPERPPCARRIGALEKTIREFAEHPSENVIFPARCPTSTATAAAICAPGKAMPLTEIVSMPLLCSCGHADAPSCSTPGPPSPCRIGVPQHKMCALVRRHPLVCRAPSATDARARDAGLKARATLGGRRGGAARRSSSSQE